ncbi:MAG: CBS domain-containing protein [Bdellovibrionales bacterium]|nr:CBS domain-containing protein [Bdellovibrionales bacterium]
MKSIPQVVKYMTTTPHSIGAEQTLKVASELMKVHMIRHLPVLTAGKITGVLSDRDIKLALSISGVDADKTRVEEIASNEVFLVRPEAKLDEVAKSMSEKKIGSVLIVDHSHLVGIFTTTDALRALDDLLQTRLSH